jgi:hypothetical protein
MGHVLTVPLDPSHIWCGNLGIAVKKDTPLGCLSFLAERVGLLETVPGFHPAGALRATKIVPDNFVKPTHAAREWLLIQPFQQPRKTPRKGALFVAGGEGGIRTHGTVTRTPDFESGPFDHSGTSPRNADWAQVTGFQNLSHPRQLARGSTWRRARAGQWQSQGPGPRRGPPDRNPQRRFGALFGHYLTCV